MRHLVILIMRLHVLAKTGHSVQKRFVQYGPTMVVTTLNRANGVGAMESETAVGNEVGKVYRIYMATSAELDENWTRWRSRNYMYMIAL